MILGLWVIINSFDLIQISYLDLFIINNLD